MEMPSGGNTGRNRWYEFDTVEAFVKKASEPFPDFQSQPSHQENSRGWTMGVTFSEAVRMTETGWVDGAKKAKEIVGLIEQLVKPVTHQQDLEYRVDGGAFVDVDRFLSGEPENMGYFIPPQRPTRPITVVVNGTVSAGVTSDFIMRRGAAIVAAIDIMESEGYSVELILEWTVGGRAGEHQKK